MYVAIGSSDALGLCKISFQTSCAGVFVNYKNINKKLEIFRISPADAPRFELKQRVTVTDVNKNRFYLCVYRTFGTASRARSHDTHRTSGDPQQLNCVFHSSLTFTGLDLPWFIWLVYQSDQYIASTVRSSYMSHFECMLER